MLTISEELTAEKETESERQLLVFGSRNQRTKSSKERNYAPPVANSWLHHCATGTLYSTSV